MAEYQPTGSTGDCHTYITQGSCVVNRSYRVHKYDSILCFLS